MVPIELAVKAIEAQGGGEQLSYAKVAEKYNVSRHTLALTHNKNKSLYSILRGSKREAFHPQER
jgi:hypothetical protein